MRKHKNLIASVLFVLALFSGWVSGLAAFLAVQDWGVLMVIAGAGSIVVSSYAAYKLFEQFKHKE